MTAAVVGASGYAGGELLRIIAQHPSLSVGPVFGGSSAGRDVADVHPHLRSLAGRTLLGTDALDEASGADIAFLALPHGASGRIAAALQDAMRVVDLGADHRLVDPADWARGYGGEHAGGWPYGLPELPGTRAVVAGAAGVAAPGCYPTATILGLAPLVAAGVVEPEDLVVVAASGTSGAGRGAKASLLGSELMGDLSAYKVGGHQHRYEMAQAIGVPTLSFTPVLAPMPRGILATGTARLRPGIGTAELREALAAAYDEEPFVHLLPEGAWPHTGATLGSNSCHVQAVADTDAGRAVVVTALDNLVKGAAGQAVQCANLMLGLDESAGLSVDGVAP